MDIMMKYGDGIVEATKLLLNCCLHQQEQLRKTEEEVGTRKWLKEFCTVRVGTARGVGHSYAVARLVERHGTDRVLITAPSEKQAEICVQQLCHPNRYPLKEFLAEPSTARRLLTRKRRASSDFRLDGIVVDIACQLGAGQVEDVYDLAQSVYRPGTPFFIIFME